MFAVIMISPKDDRHCQSSCHWLDNPHGAEVFCKLCTPHNIVNLNITEEGTERHSDCLDLTIVPNEVLGELNKAQANHEQKH